MNNYKLIIELLALHKDKGYGFQQYILNLLDYFYAHRDLIQYDEVIIVCKCSEVDFLSKYSDKFEILGIKTYNYIHRLWLQTLLPIRLGLTNNDLLLSPGNTSGLIKKCPQILVIHDLLFKRKQWINRFMRWQRELYVPKSIKNADKIIAISKFTADDILAYYPYAKEKMSVVYNYMNFDKFGKEKAVGQDYDSFFLAVSTSAVFKNQKTILKAFQQYYEEGGEKKLVLLGILSPNSIAGKTLEDLPKDLRERIIIKSRITNSELGGLYKSASCFISASLFEGLGMPVVEAMSYDCPVLLSDTEVHREVSLNKGEYFNPYDEKELASKMMNMNFGKRSYSKEIKQKFSQENTSAKYVELFNEMYKD